MSDYLPFEIQSQIMKTLPVKSLLQFRSVSKPWKSLIDSSRFIVSYNRQQTQIQQHRLLVTYYDPDDSETKYVSIADDDTFPEHKVSLTLPLLVNMLKYRGIIGSSHGLLCMYGSDDRENEMAVIWNPAIRKAVGVVVPNVPAGTIYGTVVGFGVCGETANPKIVKITHIMDWDDVESISSIPHQVEVFALSTRVWRSPNSTNLPRKSILFGLDSGSVAVDGVLYWRATDRFAVDDAYNYYNLIMSFNMTSEEFREIHLPGSLVNVDEYNLSISKLRNSLVVIRCYMDNSGFGVWMMLDGVSDSFIRIFTVKSPDFLVKGFRKTGEPIIEIVEHHTGERDISFLVAYDPYSKDVFHLEMDVSAHSFCVYNYNETLLLLDQPDFVIYDEGKATLQSGEVSLEGKNQ